MLETPVVFLIFNRPAPTSRVFDVIAAARPKRLLVVADGPRADRPGEAEQCIAARKVVSKIDWPCDVSTRFSEANLGCGRSISTGIDWAFSLVEHAIILEDDCLPHPDFFVFCTQLLHRYEGDSRIAHIGGDHFQGENLSFNRSYYFSRYPHVWGWATWRRAWMQYDFAMADWPALREHGLLEKLFADPVEQEFWRRSFDSVHSRRIDTWDIQWSYSLLKHGLLSINPTRNLISNIGFGSDATHTRGVSWMSGLPVRPIGEITHPEKVAAHGEADRRTFDIVFDGIRLREKISAGVR